MENEEIKIKKIKFVKTAIFVAMIFVSFLLIFLIYSSYFSHKVYPGVYLNKKSFAGWSYSDVYNFLESQKKILNENGINYKYENNTVNIAPIVEVFGADIANQELISFDNTKTAKEIFAVGRSGNFFNRTFEQLRILIVPKRISWQYDFDKEKWTSFLKDNFSKFEKPFKYPSIGFDGDEIIVNNATIGNEFNYEKIIKQTEDKINTFNFDDINLNLEEIKSPITLQMANSKISDAQKILDAKEINFKYGEDSWKISSANYKNWIIFKGENEKSIYVSFDFDKFKDYLEKYIAKDINQEAQDSRFKIVNGKVSEFRGNKDGKKLNIEKTFELVENELKNISNDQKNEDIELVVDVTKSDIDTSNINDFGIKEIIGTGVSDFKGSPKNRIHNIKTGANKLNGILIAPGEEFATIQNLLPVDAAGGYLPELVIKENKTMPEYGGGLCQIGTTIFRAAIQSGLNITQRRPHSYRVVYYEPAGTDATIYDPNPDMKFINDTENYILVQSRIEGTKLYFDFWGTKDGRKITVGDPVIYNIKKPGPTKQIPSSDLKPGEKKCIETAHNGADAYFDYSVEYSDNREAKKERFSSHYVPWQAVCLIGVSSNSTSTSFIGGVASSTTSTVSQ